MSGELRDKIKQFSLKEALCSAAFWISLIGVACIHLLTLNHDHIEQWDEVYHLDVAHNLTIDPTTPRLQLLDLNPNNTPYWQKSTVWMHKPVLPEYFAALSVMIGGESLFFYRFPAFLALICVAFMVRRLGRLCFGPAAGDLAGVFLLFNTLYYRFVEGRAYSDMLDAWLIFFIMASVMLMLRAKEKGRLLDWLAAGLVGGLAFLSKTYLGLTPLGICGILFIAGVTRRIERSPRFLDSLVFTGGYLLAALPINIIHYHSCPK